MKQKIILLGLSITFSALMVGCMEAANFANGFFDGYDAASTGFTLVGSSTSESSCRSLCSARGYRNHYRFNHSTKLCYCK